MRLHESPLEPVPASLEETGRRGASRGLGLRGEGAREGGARGGWGPPVMRLAAPNGTDCSEDEDEEGKASVASSPTSYGFLWAGSAQGQWPDHQVRGLPFFLFLPAPEALQGWA